MGIIEVQVLVEGASDEGWDDYGTLRVASLPMVNHFLELSDTLGPVLCSVLAVVHRLDGLTQIYVRTHGTTDFVLAELHRKGMAAFPDDPTRRTWRDLANALNSVTTIRDKIAPSTEVISDAEMHAKEWKALHNGYSRYYDSGELSLPRLTLEDQEEVVSILMMYKKLNDDYKKLSDKTGIDPADLEFLGFDGNNESEFDQVSYIVHDLGLFRELSAKSLNSHVPMLSHYCAMLRQFEALPRNFHNGLTKEQITSVLVAGKG